MTQILPPATFGQFGWYRGDSVQQNMNLPLSHVGSNSCLECHDQVNTKWALSIHSTVSCESCHGAAAEHVETNSSLGLIVPLDQLCVLCHSESISRPEEFPQINSDDHWTNITLHNIPSKINSTCTSCHEPKSKTIIGNMIPHLTKKISDCTSCHGLEQIKPFSTNHVLRPDESCSACHNHDISIDIPKISHSLEDRTVCSSCHGSNAGLQFPEDHLKRTDNLCLSCHSPDINIELPLMIPLIPHSMEDKLFCSSCHGPEELLYPENHIGISDNVCLDCHSPNVMISVPQIPHTLAGYNDCLTCHEDESEIQIPNDHVGKSENSCITCHSVDNEIHIPKLLHSIVGRLNCNSCHGNDGILEFPENHFERNDDVCVTCHKSDAVVEIPMNIPLVPHTLEDRSDCSLCHGIETDLQFPENHSERSNDICLICHEVNIT